MAGKTLIDRSGWALRHLRFRRGICYCNL